MDILGKATRIFTKFIFVRYEFKDVSNEQNKKREKLL